MSKRNARRRSGCVALRALIAGTLLAGCATPIAESEAPPKPVIVSPDLPAYEESFEARLADELDALPEPCPRDFVTVGCSTLLTFALDHIHLRDQLRELVAEPDPAE